MTTTLQPILQVLQGIKEGRAAFLLSGRSIRDLDVYPETQRLGPLLEILRQALKALTEDQGMTLVTYSRAEGLDLEAATLGSDRDRQTLETAFRAHHLLNIPQDDQEIPHVLRGISSFCRNTSALPSANGGEMRVCFWLDFAEDLAPSCAGNPSDAQIVAAEHGNLLAQSLAMRTNGHAVIWHTHDAALVSSLVRSAVHSIHLPQPKAQEKLVFLQAALQLYDKAKFEEGLSLENVAFLTGNTPNRGLEGLIRASHRGDRVITAKELVAQKSADVQMQSEGTLTVLDTAQIDPNQSLEGVNSIKPQQVLRQLAAHLANGSPHMPMNVLLVGPPATGKTEMSLAVAKLAGVSAYQMHSPKGGIVGETERKSEVQQRIRKEAIPNIAFVDEITEALPLERSDFDGDSGATRAVAAALLTALADESLRGKSLLIATTNCPYRIGAAMRSRFMMIPVLHPLQSDYGAIVLATAQKVDLQTSHSLSLQDREIAEAANLFYTKGANPRQIRAALSNALLLKGRLTPEHILFAAEDCTVPSDRISAIYADLWAVATCSAKSFFPWADCLHSYPFPDHLAGLVHPVTGEIDRAELERRIEELKPHANL